MAGPHPCRRFPVSSPHVFSSSWDGSRAYLETVTGVLYVLSGREIVSLRVQGQGISSNDSLRVAEALAAIVAPELLH